uniref:Ribonuclease H-like domain-containing protein n=1 Tax=Tanacetum cinerariifolium TaxID=118510 RepID=A0A6L2J5Z7_TANCI|nr:ribonuclease H-like domain-containing protein [Tanacetum cinerariifolium]
MPRKTDLILVDMDEYVVSESVTSVPAVATNKAKTSESKSKFVSKPLIGDWVFDSEDENEIETKESVKHEEYNSQAQHPRKNSQSPRDFKLLDESQVLLRVPRKNNMYSVDLKNVAPSGDYLGKFDRKADEGFFVGYSMNSRAFRVFNSKTRIVEETLHITFLENKPNVLRSGPTWLIDIDTLTKSMNYKPIVARNQSNGSAGKARVETVPDKDYILLPLWTQDPLFSSSSKDSRGDGFKPSGRRKRRVLKV